MPIHFCSFSACPFPEGRNLRAHHPSPSARNLVPSEFVRGRRRHPFSQRANQRAQLVGNYGLALVSLDGGGIGNSANKLAYQADSTWTKRSSYYSVGPSFSNKAWTFHLAVRNGTPADLYRVRMRMAGTGGG